MCNERLESALVKSGGSFPKTDMRFEFRPTTEGSNEHVNPCEFGDVVACGLHEFVVTGDVTTEIAKLVELR